MKKNSKKNLVHIFTLFCFFNFSGLNNGVAYAVDSAGKLQGVDFASVLLQKSINLFNPLTWKQIFGSGSYLRIFTESGRILECTSQRIIQSMISEGASLQVYLTDVSQKTFKTETPQNSLFNVTSPAANPTHATETKASTLDKPAKQYSKILGNNYQVDSLKFREFSSLEKKRMLSHAMPPHLGKMHWRPPTGTDPPSLKTYRAERVKFELKKVKRKAYYASRKDSDPAPALSLLSYAVQNTPIPDSGYFVFIPQNLKEASHV